MTIVDDNSIKLWVKILKHKDEAFVVFRKWKILVEKQIDRKVKRLRTDNGMKFCSEEFDRYYRQEGIARHKTVARTPQQNGLAERFNQLHVDKHRVV